MTNGDNGPSVEFSLTEWLTSELVAFAQPLLAAGESDVAAAAFLANIGWQSAALPTLAPAVNEAAHAIEAALTAIEPFIDGTGDEATALGELKALIALGQAVAAAVADLSKVADDTSPADLANVGEEMVTWMTDAYLQRSHPLAYGIATLLTLVTPQAKAPLQAPVTGANGQTVRAAYQLPSLNLNRLSDLMRDPDTFLKTVYMASGSLVTPDDVDAFAATLFPVVADALNGFGVNATYGLDPYFDELGLDADAAALLGRSLTLWFMDSSGSDGDAFGATLALVGPDADTDGRIGAVISPLLPTTFDGGAVGGWSISVQLGNGGGPLSVIGWTPYPADTASWPGLDLTLGLTLGQWPAGTSSSNPGVTASGSDGAGGAQTAGHPPGAQITVGLSVTDATFEATLGFAAQGTVTINPADIAGDGFLGQILPAHGFDVPLTLGISGSRQGWALTASTGQGNAIVLTRFPSTKVGPLSITDGQFAVLPQSTSLKAAATVDLGISLGPVAVNVQGLGLGLELAWPAGGGNVGPFDLSPDIAWPTGAALTIDSDLVTGGGFLQCDPAAGQYAGGLQLTFETLSLTAVGLLNTKLPSGASGYSLVVLVSVTFSPAIEVGFGFAIDGVGGLIGINRTMNSGKLQTGLQTGSLDSVLFPPDVAKNPQKEISDLEQYFPAASGQYVIGPMIQILWGEDGMFTASVGIMVEFPNPTQVTIAGRIQLLLPVPQSAVAEIEIDLAGTVDFSAKTVSFEAVLRNSRVAAFALTGGAALRASWGSSPEFLLAVGGWNPAFTPPSSFPPLQRLTLALSNSKNPTVRFEAYLALTSNTLQFGAEVDLAASADIPVLGTFALAASLGFDALIQFVPFGFTVDIHASVSLIWNKSPFLTVALDLTLSGMQPLAVSGSATFGLLGATHTFRFSHTFGAATALPAPPSVDGAALLLAELSKPANWTGALPAADSVILTGAAGRPVSGLVLHPRGTLTVRQRLMPLDVQLTHLGQAQLVGGPATYSITAATLGGAGTTFADVTDEFAMAQYLDLTDDEKLSRPSFDAQHAGVSFTSGSPSVLDAVTASTGVELHVLTRDGDGDLVAATGVAAAAARRDGDVAIRRADAVAGPGAAPGLGVPVTLVSPTYAVADLDALNAVTTALAAVPSYTDADQRRAALTAVPAGAQVVSTSDTEATPIASIAGLDPSAYYFLIACHSDKCLAVADDRLDDGAPVVQLTGTDSGNRYWRVEPVTVDSYLIVAEHSGKALSVQAEGAEDGTPVIQWDQSGGFGQEWRPVRVGSGRYRIEQVRAGLCLDVSNQGLDNDTPVQLWDWWGGLNQQWQLVRVPDGMVWHQQIVEAAYQLWLREGRPLWTHALADWQQASTSVLTPHIAAEAEAAYERRGRGPGHDRDDWYGAVAEVVGRVADAGDWPDEVREATIVNLGVQGGGG